MRDSSTHRQKVSPSMPTSGGGRDFLICISAVKRMKCVRGTVAYRAVGRELQATAAERAQGRWPGLEF